MGGQVVLDHNDTAPESAYRPEDVSGITGWIGAVSCAVLLSSCSQKPHESTVAGFARDVDVPANAAEEAYWGAEGRLFWWIPIVAVAIVDLFDSFVVAAPFVLDCCCP